ncbi:50S ribosomal protein L15 [Thermovibrio ammonificans]|jgi:large subunit ribosomal protein L15|uniref:Large ribosomal subunit protein uL15 n=1 Tax=Thermovibrio ammonificans (strain DSM 15698 / JCM 12110 / HB-1) TaxID=648996 RepID=E8T4B4_THEA1|nr:50S ribosomal protein L15 [Thermovibrio ammonificans]ADU96249.1 ribosomal protein L15 [Thermovibrio ammonificans HB-1]
MGLGLNNLKPNPGAVREKKRVGRGHGSGHGKTSGRGQKGQKARSGWKGGTRPGFEGGQTPLYMRFPKRGFSNAPFKKEYAVVNVRDLQERFEEGTEVTPELLKQVGLVKRNLPVKVLGDGELTKKLVVKAHKFSESAKRKIEEAGGSWEEIA